MKDDRLDAYVLADTLRTDGHRWRPLREDHPETKALRAMCRARKDLVETRVQVMNQLRANLELAFPGAVGLFSRPDSPITLAFLRRFPTAAKATWLSPARLDRWLRSVGYSGGIAAETLYRHLERAAPGLVGVEAEARGEITIGLVATIETLTAEITRIEAQIRKLFDAHPDQKVFASLPRPRNSTGGNTSSEDRRLPRTISVRRCAGGSRRRLTLDSAIRKTRTNRVPLVVQQEIPQGGNGFRERQPSR